MIRDEELKKIYSGKYPSPLDYVTKKSYKILLLRSEISFGTIDRISIPELPNNYSVFNHSDIPDNIIEIEDDKITILARDRVEYKGQPILIITGPELDKLNEIRKKIIIEYSETPPKIKSIYKRELHNIDIENPYKTLAGNISTGDIEYSQIYWDGVFVKKESDYLTIYSYNNWDKVLIENIKRIWEIKQDRIKIITPFIGSNEEASSFDTLYSSIICVITHLLIKKNVYFQTSNNERCNYYSRHYGIKGSWKLHYTRENEILGCDVNVRLESGAYPILLKEKVARLLFGITSYYKIKNVNIKVEVFKTPNPPNGIFPGLYLPEAVFICETLITKVANLLGYNQYKFRYDNILEKGFKSSTNKILKRDLTVKEMLEQCVSESDFLRKDTSISLIHRRRSSVLKMLPNKGVGLSLGYCGNSYISNSKGLMQNSVTVDLLQGNIVEIKISSVVNSLEFINIWKGIVFDILDVPLENISLTLMENTLDQSPLIENKNINVITPLLKQCCYEIKGRRFKDPLPITQTKYTRRASVRSWDIDSWTGEPFKNPSMGCIILETIVDKKSLEPVVNELWLMMDVGEIIDRDTLIKSVKKDILSCLSSLLGRKGVVPPKMNISFYEVGRNRRDSKAMGSIIYSMLPAAYLQSINRALGSNINRVPVTREMILKELLKVDL